ncbi:MAG: hypothetical protein JW986_09125 [Methanotrichaceae archaeon]|nr:hypothetical protein [Methanotrichaceae archaeon]
MPRAHEIMVMVGLYRRQEAFKTGGHPPWRVLELEAAKEILGEVFRASPAEVEEMIRQRMGGASPAGPRG